VALLLLHGLRSREAIGVQLEDLLLSEAQLRVRGKGRRVRLMPLPPETISILQCYLRSERPLTNVPHVFVSLKGRTRGQAMTPAGLRSLFRHHRGATAVPQANPHRFRHYAPSRTMLPRRTGVASNLARRALAALAGFYHGA